MKFKLFEISGSYKSLLRMIDEYNTTDISIISPVKLFRMIIELEIKLGNIYGKDRLEMFGIVRELQDKFKKNMKDKGVDYDEVYDNWIWRIANKKFK